MARTSGLRPTKILYEGEYYKQQMEYLSLMYSYDLDNALRKKNKKVKDTIECMESKIEEYNHNILKNLMGKKEGKKYISSAKSKYKSYIKLYIECYKHQLKIILAKYNISIMEFKKSYYIMKYDQVLKNESYEVDKYKYFTPTNTFNDKEKKYFIKRYNEFKDVIIPEVNDLVYKKTKT